MCCFSCKAQKITTSRVFNLISDSLENRRWPAKMATIVGDVTGLQQQENQRFST